MLILRSIAVGLITAATSILLHQTLPPLGIILGLTSTYFGIWSIGRWYGKRTLKLIASLTWLAVITRAGTFGAGQELLVQGDGAGSTLLLFGAATVFAATIARN